MSYLIVFVLVSLSALFSGLTLGLFSLNKTDLERKIALGDKQAKKIYPVRKDGNFLLTTLLLGNVAVNSALSIFLGSIESGIVAGITATALIVVFGEIVPQAVFSRFALTLGSKITWLVRFFMILFYPIAKPLALALDAILGKELPTVWSRKELKQIVRFHEDAKESDLDADEERILLGALSFSDKKAEDIMTPRTVVFAVDTEKVLTKETINNIKDSGFDRVIVKKGRLDNVKGILYSRDLIGVEPGTKVDAVYCRDCLITIKGNKKLDSLLNDFLKKKNHIALVFGKYGEFRGVVTLEDIIEEVLNVEIIDEDDQVVDLRAVAKKKAKKMLER
ncbi:DUF21 domain-containing protein [Patescibacteria group bacterium]|nr:DUF21 domain-containing protein [Patescibacteria group bacterium]